MTTPLRLAYERPPAAERARVTAAEIRKRVRAWRRWAWWRRLRVVAGHVSRAAAWPVMALAAVIAAVWAWWGWRRVRCEWRGTHTRPLRHPALLGWRCGDCGLAAATLSELMGIDE
jgi:hypothetical protein